MMRFLIEGLFVRVRAFTQPVSTARRLESQALRTLLKEARDALDYFRRWGEGVSTAIGHYPPAGAWKPTFDAIARIDAALTLERWDYGRE